MANKAPTPPPAVPSTEGGAPTAGASSIGAAPGLDLPASGGQSSLASPPPGGVGGVLPPQNPPTDGGATQRVAPVEEPKAFVKESKEAFSARPDPQQPVGDDVPVVRYNWSGLYKNRRADVASGTPVNGLPHDLIREIEATRNAVIAPRGAKLPDNPFTR